MSTTTLELTQVPTVTTGMLVRRPPEDVFEAFADPEVTTKFWYTRSTGRMTPGARLTWEWEMYGISTSVKVREVDDNRRILFDWDDDPTTVELRFTPWADGATFVEVTESGLYGTGDEVAAHAAGSTGGFSIVLCALKALLEHDIDLGAVRDRFPKGVDH
jgi:uncharacterized protein YndB with AHSA1/START domain